METSGPHINEEPPLARVLADFAGMAREQVEAAWQLYVARVQEQLVSGWQCEIEQIVTERFAELGARMAEEFEAALGTRLASELSVALPRAAEAARRELIGQLNQSVRRLARVQTTEEWAAALLEAMAGFCERVVLFAAAGKHLKAIAARGIGPQETLSRLLALEVPLADAPAFAHVVETQESVISMRAAGELSEPVVALLGGVGEAKATLIPVSSRQKTVAVLYADGDASLADPGALELLAALSTVGLEAARVTSAVRPGGLVPLASLEPSAAAAVSPVWEKLPKPDQELHLRAQRFARVQVAEMRLYKSRAVRSGRMDANLYGTLKEEIDAGREAFRRQFLASTASMVDYFHQEVVRSLGNDDARLLGPDYPGPLA